MIKPACFSKKIYSAPRGFSDAPKHHEYTPGIGMFQNIPQLIKLVLTRKGIEIEKIAGHTKYIVAISLTVVKCGLDVLGFRCFVISPHPLSMISWNTMLYWPSDIFNTEVREPEPMTEASSCRSAEIMDLT